MSDVPDRSTPVLLVMSPTRLPRRAPGTSSRKTSMPGRTPAAAGAADTGVGAPHNSMMHARKALSVSR